MTTNISSAEKVESGDFRTKITYGIAGVLGFFRRVREVARHLYSRADRRPEYERIRDNINFDDRSTNPLDCF